MEPARGRGAGREDRGRALASRGAAAPARRCGPQPRSSARRRPTNHSGSASSISITGCRRRRCRVLAVGPHEQSLTAAETPGRRAFDLPGRIRAFSAASSAAVARRTRQNRQGTRGCRAGLSSPSKNVSRLIDGGPGRGGAWAPPRNAVAGKGRLSARGRLRVWGLGASLSSGLGRVAAPPARADAAGDRRSRRPRARPGVHPCPFDAIGWQRHHRRHRRGRARRTQFVVVSVTATERGRRSPPAYRSGGSSSTA